jgi:type III pantothenate kinase
MTLALDYHLNLMSGDDRRDWSTRKMMENPRSQGWLALAIGNSRLHWAAFTESPSGQSLQQVWHTPHLIPGDHQSWTAIDWDFRAVSPFPEAGEFSRGFAVPEVQAILATLPAQPSLYIASVVPQQSQLWAAYPQAHFLSLSQIPLQGLYASFGLDRALTLWGAIGLCAAPVLVIDAGTAITLSGADRQHRLVGGAILPGLRLQLRALGQSTAGLPELSTQELSTEDFPVLPPRWATDTTGAIASGVLHTLLASLHSFIADWRRQFPQSPVVITGGDGDRLHAGLQRMDPAIAISLRPNLIFQGIQTLVPRA